MLSRLHQDGYVVVSNVFDAESRVVFADIVADMRVAPKTKLKYLPGTRVTKDAHTLTSEHVAAMHRRLRAIGERLFTGGVSRDESMYKYSGNKSSSSSPGFENGSSWTGYLVLRGDGIDATFSNRRVTLNQGDLLLVDVSTCEFKSMSSTIISISKHELRVPLMMWMELMASNDDDEFQRRSGVIARQFPRHRGSTQFGRKLIGAVISVATSRVSPTSAVVASTCTCPKTRQIEFALATTAGGGIMNPEAANRDVAFRSWEPPPYMTKHYEKHVQKSIHAHDDHERAYTVDKIWTWLETRRRLDHAFAERLKKDVYVHLSKILNINTLEAEQSMRETDVLTIEPNVAIAFLPGDATVADAVVFYSSNTNVLSMAHRRERLQALADSVVDTAMRWGRIDDGVKPTTTTRRRTKHVHRLVHHLIKAMRSFVDDRLDGVEMMESATFTSFQRWLSAQYARLVIVDDEVGIRETSPSEMSATSPTFGVVDVSTIPDDDGFGEFTPDVVSRALRELTETETLVFHAFFGRRLHI